MSFPFSFQLNASPAMDEATPIGSAPSIQHGFLRGGRGGRHSHCGRGVPEGGEGHQCDIKFFLIFNLFSFFFKYVTCTFIFRLFFEHLNITNILISFCAFLYILIKMKNFNYRCWISS